MIFVELKTDNPAKKDSWKLTISDTTLFNLTKARANEILRERLRAIKKEIKNLKGTL